MVVTGDPEMKVARVEGDGVGDQTLTTPDWSADTTLPPTLDTDTNTTELLCSEYSSCPNKMYLELEDGVCGMEAGVGTGDTSTGAAAGSNAFVFPTSSGFTDWVTLFKGCLLIIKLCDAVTFKLIGGATMLLVLELDLDLCPAWEVPRTGDFFLSVLLELPAPVMVLRKLFIDLT